MNYKAFYRTYRPDTFAKVVGQDHIVTTLTNIITLGKVAHGYLFCGPRGTGKTSVARIFANALNCTHAPGATICNECQTNASKSLDVIEIDAASNNGVNDIRTIREQVNFAPTHHPYKIYIIDEVHMLSKGAFNALLMTLEEPPQHAIFILATTNPDKIPETVLSRVQRYNFRRISKAVLHSQLEAIFATEAIRCEPEALALIVSLANGSLRDALSIADQINAYTSGSITAAALGAVFGLVAIETQIALLNQLGQGDLGGALQTFEELVSAGSDISRLTSGLIHLLKDLLVLQKTGDENLIETTTRELIDTMTINSEHIYPFLEVLTPLLAELKYSEIPQQLFQLALIKLCARPKPAPEPTPDAPEPEGLTPGAHAPSAEVVAHSNPAEQQPQPSAPSATTLLNEFNTHQLEQRFAELLATAPNAAGKPESEAAAPAQKPNESDNEPPGGGAETEAFSFQNSFDTDEIIDETTNILSTTNELDAIGLEVNETLLDPTQELETLEPNTIYDTNQIDTQTSHLSTEDGTGEFELRAPESPTTSTPPGLENLAIVNLFLLAERASFADFKARLVKTVMSIKSQFGLFTSLLKEVKFVCSGTNFILVSAKEDWIIHDLRRLEPEPAFHQFLSQSFGPEVHFWAITKAEYQQAKQLYHELRAANQLPEAVAVAPKVVAKPNPDESGEDKHRKTELKARALLGHLFKKKSHT